MALTVNPVFLIAGTVGAPIVANAVGRTFITARQPATEAEGNAELRRLMGNFALYNGLLAAILGYVAAKAPLEEQWRSAALGGAIGTGLIAALLFAGLLTAPKREELAPTGGRDRLGFAQLGATPTTSTWISNLVGFPAQAA